MPDRSIPFRNFILDQLSDADLSLLGPLSLVDLTPNVVLEAPDTPIEFAYFVETGIVSMTSMTVGKSDIDVGLIGYEGMTGTALVMADTMSPFASIVQVEGTAYRIAADQLAEATATSPSISSALVRYARILHLQIAATSVAHGSAKLEARLARWLLMMADRVGNSFNITHAVLGTSLAVRRSGVTLSLQTLEGQGLIRAGRGVVTIVDRQGLERATNGTYGLAEREQARLSTI